MPWLGIELTELPEPGVRYKMHIGIPQRIVWDDLPVSGVYQDKPAQRFELLGKAVTFYGTTKYVVGGPDNPVYRWVIDFTPLETMTPWALIVVAFLVVLGLGAIGYSLDKVEKLIESPIVEGSFGILALAVLLGTGGYLISRFAKKSQ